MSSGRESTRSSSSSSSSAALRTQLSRQLSSAVAGASAGLDPTLRAALAQPSRQQSATSSLPFAARAVLDPDNLQASLDMFRRLRSSRRSESAGEAGKRERAGRRPGGGSDSARATDEGGTPRSQSSLLELLDENWSGPQPQQPAAASTATMPPPPSKLPLPFAPRSSSGSPPSSAGQPSVGSSGSTAASETAAFYDAEGSLGASLEEELAAAAAGCDTPRSTTSWTSCLSSALPQTEAELQGLDLGEVERLAAEAAELQSRAAVALRLARARMGGSGGSALARFVIPEEHKEQRQAVAAEETWRAKGGTAVRATVAEAKQRQGDGSAGGTFPTAAGMALQLYLLLLVLLESALLAGARLAQRASLGALRPPRELVLAPVAAARCALCLAMLAADVLFGALGALQRHPGRVAA